MSVQFVASFDILTLYDPLCCLLSTKETEDSTTFSFVSSRVLVSLLFGIQQLEAVSPVSVEVFNIPAVETVLLVASESPLALWATTS